MAAQHGHGVGMIWSDQARLGHLQHQGHERWRLLRMIAMRNTRTTVSGPMTSAAAQGLAGGGMRSLQLKLGEPWVLRDTKSYYSISI
jgi:hypothetical protein